MLYNLTADIHVLCKTHKKHIIRTPIYMEVIPESKKIRVDLKFFCAILPTELLCTGDSAFEYGGGLCFQVTPAESETLSEGSIFFQIYYQNRSAPSKN